MTDEPRTFGLYQGSIDLLARLIGRRLEELEAVIDFSPGAPWTDDDDEYDQLCQLYETLTGEEWETPL